MKTKFLCVAIALAALIGACGHSGVGATGGTGGGGAGGGSSSGIMFDAGPMHTLVVEPPNPTLDVGAPGVTQQFSAVDPATNMPVVATWTVDAAGIGTIDANGLFTASGVVGGQTLVTATSGNLQGSTTLKVVLHLTDNPGNVDPATQAKLQAGGNADPALRWLYPYDKTVFPRGLTPPTLQLGGTAADAAFVHVSFAGLDYKGFYGASSPTRLDLTQALWETITLSASGTDAVEIEVTKISGGQVAGPVAETWTIAQGSLKGYVYYDTYDTPKVAGSTAIMRIEPGKGGNAQVVHPGCYVCHSVSADGSTIAAADSYMPSGSPYAAWSADLKTNATLFYALPTDASYPGDFSYGGLYPDGSLMVRDGTAQLVDPKTGAKASSTGIPAAVSGLGKPSFAPNGKRVAFVYGSTSTVGVLDFDVGTMAFSNLVDVAQSATSTLSWPSMTPDSKWVVFQDGNRTDGYTYDLGGTKGKGDLTVALVASKTSAKLDAANGIANGSPYLPFGDEEAHMNYEPSILPITVGGYAWVVFDSRRQYGNTINDANPYASNIHNPPDGPARRKKLWVAALDLVTSEMTVVKDISHPAFYLPGQELESGNQHASWALPPCQQNGTDCASGDECCTGFCRQTNGADGGMSFSCVPPPGGCAKEFEKCTTAADCCGSQQGYQCINGHCARPAPQ